MNEVTKIDIACGWDEEEAALVAEHVHTGNTWYAWVKHGKGEFLNAGQDCFSSEEQDDSVLGLIGAVFQDGSIVSIDDWKLYDADFDAPQELLDQLQAWEEYGVTEDTSEISVTSEDNAAQMALAKLKEAIKEALDIKPKTRKEKIKDAVLMVLVNVGASVLFVMASMLMFLFAVVNTHKTLVHINEYGMGSAEYLMAATALMLFALAWFGTERLFNRLVK